MASRIKDAYFNWICDMVLDDCFSDNVSYIRLLTRLDETEFTYIVPRDRNRAADGVDLRYRFALRHEKELSIDYVLDELDGPCSVLEMMVALAIRCEENIMDNALYGDRTVQWFWQMISSLGLSDMTDAMYDQEKVDYILKRFLNRRYSSNGKGGLFTIRNCDKDLRKVEIWFQLCWYLDSIT